MHAPSESLGRAPRRELGEAAEAGEVPAQAGGEEDRGLL